MKTGKIQSVRESVRTYTGINGTLYVHMITLAEPVDGVTEWEYHSKTPQCTKFTAGAETTFTTTVKVNGKYTDYKISPVMAPPGGGAPTGGGARFGSVRETKDEGKITALSAASSACNFYAHRAGATPEMVLAMAEKIYEFANAKSSK